MEKKIKLTKNQLYKIKAILRDNKSRYMLDYERGIDKIIIKLLKMAEEIDYEK